MIPPSEKDLVKALESVWRQQREVTSKRGRCDKALVWRVARSGVRCPPAVWNQVPPSDARGAPSGFGVELVHEEDFYTTLGDVHDAMLWPGAQLRVYLVLG